MSNLSKRSLLIAGLCAVAIISAIGFFIALGEAHDRVDRAYAEQTGSY